MLHAFDRSTDDFVLRHVQLVLPMDGARGEEHVDAFLRRRLHGLGDELDVVAIATREATDDRSLYLARHRVHAFPITARRGGEARFDDIHPKFRKRACHPKLLGLRHAASRRLLAVAQRRVEDHDSFTMGHGDYLC